MLQHTEIEVKDIQVGFILDEDIHDDGVLLLSKGQIITERIKELLQNRGKVKVIKDTVIDTNYIQEDLNDDRLVVLNDEIRERISNDITNLFENIESNTNLATSISDTLVNDVLKKDGIGLNLESLKISDEYTFKHSVDVAAASIILGKYLGLGEDSLRDIGTAGILHDIGKIKIPNEILNKNGRLTDDEFRIIKNHPVYGYQMLADNKQLSEPIRRAVLYHHEKYCGGGYPSGIEGSKIPLYARILTVVDVFDALVTERPYHKAYSVKDTIELMYTMASQFDMEIFQAFLNSVILYPIGTLVELTNGTTCQVIKSNKGYPVRPIVKDINSGVEYDLASDSNCLTLFIKE